jgi:hypothetical protein
MSWVITGSEKTPVDPQFGSVSLLLHGNGTNGSTTFTDNSPIPKTVTAVGNAQISTAQSKFGGASILLDGTGDYLSIGNDTALALGSTWTIEFFVYLNTFGAGASRNGFISTGTLNTTGHLQIYSESGPVLIARCGGTGSNDAESGSSPFSTATWTHLAFVCNNLATTIYVSGSANGTGTLASASTVPITRIGNAVFAGYDLDGYIDDLRITKGVARYTANFTPPAAQFPDI